MQFYGGYGIAPIVMWAQFEIWPRDVRLSAAPAESLD